MGKVTTFAERVKSRLQRHSAVQAENQQQLDRRMEELLEERERWAALAEEKLRKVALPRMEELARNFPNADIEVLHSDEAYICAGKFTHTEQFPATVKFALALLPNSSEQLTARYDLTILPALMNYNRYAEHNFPMEDEEALADWVEERILDFLDNYLRLETHPFYQKDNLVLDVVCGMQISKVTASSSVHRHGSTHYFCSEHCKNKFLEGGSGDEAVGAEHEERK